jgi:Xaa-Pro aminopeptidase
MPQFLNKKRIMEAMEKEGVEAVVATTPENILYVSDAPLQGGAVLPREKNIDPFVVTWVAYVDKFVDSNSWIKDAKYCGTFFFEYFPENKLIPLEQKMREQVAPIQKEVENWWKLQRGGIEGVPGVWEKIVEGLKERGLEKGTIGIEEKGITVSGFQSLQKKLPLAKFKFADKIFNYARMIKTPYELELFRKGTPIVERGIKAACEIVKEGVTEQEILNEFKRAVVSEGAGVNYNLIVAVGHRSVGPTTCAGLDHSAKVEKGDMLRFNPSISWKNYYFHMGRTAVLGTPKDSKLKPYYKAILAGENAELAAIRPGVKACDIYEVCVKAVREAGIPHYRRHMTGHALGIAPTYDQPIIAFNDETVLEEGMVFNLEPNYFELGLGGLQLEDTLVVTKNGYELFTTTSRDLWQL